MFNKLMGAKAEKSPFDSFDEIIAAVPKSPELIAAEEKLAALRAKHTQLREEMGKFTSRIGRFTDGNEENRVNREIVKLSAQLKELEAEMREVKALRNDLSWPWKHAVAEAARPALEAKAKEMLEHFSAGHKLTTELLDLASKHPAAIPHSIPMSLPGVQGWIDFARKILGEKIL
jgi:uncharacterized coiled-coil DUF342 family protein